jgi:NAD(P)-dependent dehydrogenase (short-subunit alcohol dehydrogenase family)
MSRIFITGSTDGLGRAAAEALIDAGHHVILHARSSERATAFSAMDSRRSDIVIGDLASASQTHAIAEQVNAIGGVDAVIHNAGVYQQSDRNPTSEGHPTILAVNVLAPFILTALIDRPKRLIYLSSGMHKNAGTSLDDIEWKRRRWSAGTAYSESKLYVATFAAAAARYWPDAVSSAVDPGWVPTKMGGAGAPDDLAEGHRTQAWLAASDDTGAKVSGRYWYHRKPQAPAAAVGDTDFQDRLVMKLAEITGVSLG